MNAEEIMANQTGSNAKSYSTRTTCRCCGSADLVPLFSLGEQRVSDFVDEEDLASVLKVPIDIELCRACTLVQAKHSPPPEQLYKRHYWYKSGTTVTMRRALRDVTRSVEERACLVDGDCVLDIGSNDGTLLRSYSTSLALHKIGVEPADNMFKCGGAKGLDQFISAFWGDSFALDSVARWGPGVGAPRKMKAVTACGVFYDLEDPNAFIADIAKALAPDGLFVAQLMCAKQTLARCDVGNFVHEHLEFYTLASLDALFYKHGLAIYDIKENSVNGGSYRLYAQHAKSVQNSSMSLQSAYRHEDRMHLDDPVVWDGWFAKLKRNRQAVVDFVKDAAARRKKVWVYGASTKGNVILQWLGLDRSLIKAAADRDPAKVGKFMSGGGVPIKSEDEFREVNPDYALVLPYAFRGEILEREAEWRNRGGRFIFPLPMMEVV